MNMVLSTLTLLIFLASQLSAESVELLEPGPEDGGLRMRLVITSETSEDRFEVRVDLLNTSESTVTLQADWRNDTPGDLKDYIEAATSIECVPAVIPWSGGVQETGRKLPQPEYRLQAGEVLSARWQTRGRHLKNSVTNPNEVQNPEFPIPGLYSVHASLIVVANQRVVALRSNEQLVPVGGSLAMPKSTFGHLLEVDQQGNSAVLDLGARHKVEPGDQFEHFSKQTPWKLIITKVAPDHSWGQIKMLSTNSDSPPRPGMGVSLNMKQ